MPITTTILIILGLLALVLIVALCLYISIKTSVKEAVSNAKPSTVNYGTIINHNHSKRADESLISNDEKYLQLSRYAGAFAKQLLSSADNCEERKRKKRKK